MSEYTLLFGVGAQKSGTSWLHRYLSSHRQYQFVSDHFRGDIPDRWKQNLADALR